METHGPNSQKADSVVRGKKFMLLVLFCVIFYFYVILEYS